jgi:hypothetical protein
MTDNPWAPPQPPWTEPVPPVWSGTPPPPPPSSFRVPWVAILSCVVVAVLVAGTVIAVDRNSGHSSAAVNVPPPTLVPTPTVPGAPTTPTTPTAPTAPAGPPVSAADAAALHSMVLTQNDVGTADQVGVINGGDQVQAPTLDLCNGTYPSETRRVARLQVAAQQSSFSTEAVLYDSAGGTAQAFTELRGVAAKCPASPVVSPVGEQTVTTHFNSPPDASWPSTSGVERLAYDFTATDSQGNTVRSIAVYMRRGRAFIGVYFAAATGAQLTVDGQSTIPTIVKVFADRMAKLSGSIVNGHETPVGVPGAI